MQDKLFLDLISQNNEDGLKTLLEKYYNNLLNFAFNIIGNLEPAEEIVQDSFFYLWEKRHNLPEELDVSAYLHKIVKNDCIDWLRKKVNKQNLHHRISPSELQLDESPIEKIISSELSVLLKEAVLNLPEKCQYIFRLSRYSNLSHKKIANQLGVSPKTVENQVAIALKKIRSYIKMHGFSLLI